MNRPPLGRKLAILAAVASLAVGAALSPTAASAHTATAAKGAKTCGSKSIAVPAAGKTVHVAVSRIKVAGGATCAQATVVISGYVRHKTPSGWTVKQGTFHVPHGLTAETATKGEKTIQFALVGGY